MLGYNASPWFFPTGLNLGQSLVLGESGATLAQAVYFANGAVVASSTTLPNIGNTSNGGFGVGNSSLGYVSTGNSTATAKINYASNTAVVGVTTTTLLSNGVYSGSIAATSFIGGGFPGNNTLTTTNTINLSSSAVTNGPALSYSLALGESISTPTLVLSSGGVTAPSGTVTVVPYGSVYKYATNSMSATSYNMPGNCVWGVGLSSATAGAVLSGETALSGGVSLKNTFVYTYSTGNWTTSANLPIHTGHQMVGGSSSAFGLYNEGNPNTDSTCSGLQLEKLSYSGYSISLSSVLLYNPTYTFAVSNYNVGVNA